MPELLGAGECHEKEVNWVDAPRLIGVVAFFSSSCHSKGTFGAPISRESYSVDWGDRGSVCSSHHFVTN